MNRQISPLQTLKKRQPLLTEALDKTGFAFDEDHAYMLDTAEPRRPLVRRAKLKDIGRWAITSKLSPEEICKVFHASDAPLRAHKIKLLTCSENSELDNLLYQAYALSKKYKLDQDHVFNAIHSHGPQERSGCGASNSQHGRHRQHWIYNHARGASENRKLRQSHGNLYAADSSNTSSPFQGLPEHV